MIKNLPDVVPPSTKVPADPRSAHVAIREDSAAESRHRPYIQPIALAVLATYRCTAACAHCCFDSNPGITHRLDLDSILETIEQASRYASLEIVSFSGGECFLLGEDLNAAVAYTAEKGLITRCVTNGYWAKSYDAGKRRLEGLRDSGLKELSISTGDNHLEYVTLDTVVNAVILSLELSMRTDVVVELTKDRKATARDVSEHPRILALPKEQREALNLLESPWMPMDHEELIEQPSRVLLNKDTVSNFGPCDSVLTTLALTPYKRIGLCCGLSRELIPELTVDYQDLDVILEQAGSDFMKIWLSIDGPERIVAWAASKDPTIDWENKYAHRCQACLALYRDEKIARVIRKHYHERVSDVLFRHTLKIQKQELLTK